MIKKMFKTVLVLSLCLGITLPTNAAVSVSDGSAFVTKAEFAADLNNLSNRMAQLENSLDAKIDSLVSSYLTRNGIWNGARQTMANIPTGHYGMRWVPNSSLRGYVLNSPFDTPSSSFSGGIQCNSNGLYVSSSFCYSPGATAPLDVVAIPNCNKSGLCNLVVNFSDTTYAFSTFMAYSLDNTYDSVHGDYWGTFFTQEYLVLVDSDLAYYNLVSFPMPAHAAYTLSFPQVINCYFFVNKDQIVTFQIKPTVRNGYRPQLCNSANTHGVSISNWYANIY